jgi:hypothetical protein
MANTPHFGDRNEFSAFAGSAVRFWESAVKTVAI